MDPFQRSRRRPGAWIDLVANDRRTAAPLSRAEANLVGSLLGSNVGNGDGRALDAVVALRAGARHCGIGPGHRRSGIVPRVSFAGLARGMSAGARRARPGSRAPMDCARALAASVDLYAD